MTATATDGASGGAAAVALQGVRLALGGGVGFACPDLRVEPGERVALTGPSGCGKSTLLALIGGLRAPDAGSVEVLGTRLAALAPAARDGFRGRHIGFVFQTFHLLASFTARENVELGLAFGPRLARARRRALAGEWLERVGLAARAGHRPAALSVGERQRVAIARAAAGRPALILADEPTGALDPETAAGVFDLLLALAAENASTLLFVTHDRELAARLPRRFDCSHLVARTTATPCPA
jgi:putative ABC transport system ATP-binding protein